MWGGNGVSRFTFKIGGLVALALLAVPVAVAGGSLAGDVYGGTGGDVQSGVLGSEATSSSLPFTGLSLAFFVVLGLVLIGTGLVLRRRATD
jgi:hypothetical protein